MRLAGAIVLLAAAGAAQTLRVTETAGIRRFSYPVTARLPANIAAGSLRLTENGKPVAAQFQGAEIDFNVSLGPFEKREFRLEDGPAAPRQTGAVRKDGDDFVVAYAPGLEFVVPQNLRGFLKAVRTPKREYVRPDSQGLLLRYRDDIIYRVGGFGPHGAAARARVAKEGPLATTLEFASTEALRGSRSVESTVRMEFPRSKSWVKTAWTVEDPEALISGLGLELNLNIAGEPALVDFGGGSMVYAQLRAGQSAALVGTPQSWRVLLGPAAALEPFVSGRAGVTAEGWAHLMDRERCTAIAVADFGRRQDRIEAAVDGTLRIWRDVAGAGPKTLTFWLHFVSMPVQVGAATSPQAMLAPLKAEWLGGSTSH